MSEIQDEKPENEWNWGDVLHDRISGLFARKLTEKARAKNDESLLAYCCGYKSHLITDFLGHPYVNQVVGGPARGFNQRHTIAEKFMDTQVFAKRGLEIYNSNIRQRFHAPDNLAELDPLFELLQNQMQELKNNETSFPFPIKDPVTLPQLRQAFESMYKLFSYITSQTSVHPPTKPKLSITPLHDAKYGSINRAQVFLEPPRKVNQWSLSDWLKAVLNALSMAPTIFADFARAANDILAGLYNYPMEALLYLFHSFLYRLFRFIRWFLVISGTAFPMNDELNTELGRQFIKCRQREQEGYPRRPRNVNRSRIHFRRSGGGEFEFTESDDFYLDYPNTTPERPYTISSIYKEGDEPDLFINGNPINGDFIQSWQQVKTPGDLRTLVGKNVGGNGFGNAVDLSIFYLDNEIAFDHINLDADRGYGYYQWQCDTGSLKAGNLVNEHFISFNQIL